MLGEYIYNGKGQRAEKWIASENKCTIYHYDLNGLLIAESTSSGTIKAEYVYLNGQPLAKIENNSMYFYHNDHLGSPMMMTNSSASTVWEGEFLPFGEEYYVSGSITNNLRFPGQYYDSETGLHYNYYRDYNPAIGRYVEADPIGIKRGQNHLYGYVGNNPVNWVDPLGLKRFCFGCRSKNAFYSGLCTSNKFYQYESCSSGPFLVKKECFEDADEEYEKCEEKRELIKEECYKDCNCRNDELPHDDRY